MRDAFLFLVLMCVAGTVWSGEIRYYDVEVVIFENLTRAEYSSEQWPRDVEISVPEKYIDLGSPFTGQLSEEFDPKKTFVPLQANQLRLGREATALEKSKKYRVLTHIGWRQPGMPVNQALPVHIERVIPALPDAPEQTTRNLSRPGLDNPLGDGVQQVDIETPRNYLLNGFVRLTLSRYLHVKADLSYQQENVQDESQTSWSLLAEPDDAETLVDNRPLIYRLLQTRRMRSGELHYLDNPMLGMLVIVTPVKDKKAS